MLWHGPSRCPQGYVRQCHEKPSVPPSDYTAPEENAGAAPAYSVFIILCWAGHAHTAYIILCLLQYKLETSASCAQAATILCSSGPLCSLSSSHTRRVTYTGRARDLFLWESVVAAPLGSHPGTNTPCRPEKSGLGQERHLDSQRVGSLDARRGVGGATSGRDIGQGCLSLGFPGKRALGRM